MFNENYFGDNFDKPEKKWLDYEYIEDREHLGLALREVRKKKKLTQQKVASMTNIDIKTLRKIEQGSASYSIDKLFRLLRLYGYHLSNLTPTKVATSVELLNRLEELYG